MSVWVLFIIMLDATQYYVQPNSLYSTMDECFAAREVVMQSAPQPKINYEAVCVQADKIQLQ